MFRSFLWQFSWRAPGLEPGTGLSLHDKLTFAFDYDEAFSIHLNSVYASAQNLQPFPYDYQFISMFLEQKLAAMLASQQSSNAIVVRLTALNYHMFLIPSMAVDFSNFPRMEM